MSTNCLVTKLKGVVDNPNLKKLGVISVTGTFDNARTVGNPVSGQVITKTLSGGLKAYTDNTKATEIVSPFTNGTFYLDGTGTIEYDNKYKLASIVLQGAQAADLTYCTLLTSIEDIAGDIADLPNLDSCIRIVGTTNTAWELYGSVDNLPDIASGLVTFKGNQHVVSKGLSGDVRKFAKYIETKNININYDTKITGNIEDLVHDMAVTYGRTSGTLWVNISSTPVKFNGTHEANHYINFGELTVTVEDSSHNLLGTYTKANDSWVYA